MKVKPRGPILDQPVVLLVEDETLVRLTQVDILRDAGFWVLEAADADEAFETIRQRGGGGVGGPPPAGGPARPPVPPPRGARLAGGRRAGDLGQGVPGRGRLAALG